MNAGQIWTGGDDEDFEQNCSPNPNPFPDPAKPAEHCNIVWDKYGAEKGTYWPSCPGRPAFSACNYTCQYLLAGLEPDRFQVQILHEYDTCCFSVSIRAVYCCSLLVSVLVLGAGVGVGILMLGVELVLVLWCWCFGGGVVVLLP